MTPRKKAAAEEPQQTEDPPAIMAPELQERAEEAAAHDGPDPCPLCGGVGHLAVAPRQHDRYTTCPGCHGYGMVATGARTAESAILPCPDCDGRGYQDVSLIPPQPAQGNGGNQAAGSLGYVPFVG